MLGKGYMKPLCALIILCLSDYGYLSASRFYRVLCQEIAESFILYIHHFKNKPVMDKILQRRTV